MSKLRSQRSGRKNNNDRIRELVALLGSLSSTGDVVTIDAISSRLGLSTKDAQDMMDIVCQASGEEWGGLLISSNDEGTEFTLQYPGTHGKPVRLTKAETIALFHALDLAGINDEDPLRAKLTGAFSSSGIDEDTVRQMLGTSSFGPPCLRTCAQAQVEQRELLFYYQGSNDEAPKSRRCAVRSIIIQDVFWYVLSFDLDLEQDRTFRVDRITDASLGKAVVLSNASNDSPVRRVGITFLDPSYYTMFDWPGIHVLRTTNGILQCSIPYYGEKSTWLLRRICAGKGRIIVDDNRIMRAAQNYAQKLLDELV